MRTSYPPLKYITTVLFGALFGGCVSTEKAAPPISPRMAALSDTSPLTLELGRRTFTGRCTACHSIRPVTRYSPDRWRPIIDEMAEQAKLSAMEKSAVLNYVLAARSVVTTAPPP